MNDSGRLGNVDVLVSRRGASLGLSARCAYVAIIMVVVVVSAAIPARATVFTASGHALKVVAAVEDTLLDKVIAATEIGVRSQTTGRTVTGWGMARFSGAVMGPLFTIAVSAAGLYVSAHLDEWFAEHDYYYDDQTKTITKAGPVAYNPHGEGVGTYPCNYGTPPYISISYETVRATAAECQAAGYSSSMYSGHCGWISTYWAEWFYQDGAPYYTKHACMSPKNASAWVTYDSGSPVNLDPGEMEDAFETDFQVDGSLARDIAKDVIDYLGLIVEKANERWPGTVPDSTGYTPLTPAQGDEVQEAMNDALDPQAKADLQDAADQNGTMNPAGSQSGANQDWEYTPEQMAAAQYAKDLERENAYLTDWEASKPDDGNGSGISAGTYTLPERRDLPSVLDTFKDGLSSLPIVSWANGVNISVSGANSIVNLPIPAAWGGSITVDFADYEDILDIMGNGLFALVGMASVLFLFRGRGD